MSNVIAIAYRPRRGRRRVAANLAASIDNGLIAVTGPGVITAARAASTARSTRASPAHGAVACLRQRAGADTAAADQTVDGAPPAQIECANDPRMALGLIP